MGRRGRTRSRSGSGAIAPSGPPLPAFLVGYWETDQGITDTAGEASAWASKTPGSITLTGAAAQRADIVTGPPKLLRFNGTTDKMTFAQRGVMAKATFGAWIKVSSAISVNDTLFSTAGLGGGYLLAGTTSGGGPSAAERWLISLNGATSGTMNSSADGQIKKDVWVFVAVVYDGAGATANDRCKVYYREHGQTVFTLQPQLAGGTIPASLTAGAGDGAYCDLIGFNRQLPNDTRAAYYYEGAALTTAQLMTLSQRMDPLAGVKTVMALGDSLVLGVGDAGNAGGFRSDVLALAGGGEVFWYLGTVSQYAANAPNNRCEAVGGSKADAHLTFFTAALAAGWDPGVILYCGGRNDISAGEVALLPARYTALFAGWGGRRAIVHTVVDTVPTGPDTAVANGHLATAAAAFPNVTIVTSAAVGAADGVHPDAANYQLMAAAIYTALSPLL